MVDGGVPATLERKMMYMAVVTFLIGAAVLGWAGWTALGWVIMAYGIMTLCSAYLFAVASHVDDPEESAHYFKQEMPEPGKPDAA